MGIRVRLGKESLAAAFIPRLAASSNRRDAREVKAEMITGVLWPSSPLDSKAESLVAG